MSEIANIFVFGGASSKLGLSGKIALPFVVVLSGSSKIGRLGCRLISAGSVVSSFAESWFEDRGSGCRRGGRKARKMLLRREVRRMRREEGYVVVKMGSKIAAR